MATPKQQTRTSLELNHNYDTANHAPTVIIDSKPDLSHVFETAVNGFNPSIVTSPIWVIEPDFDEEEILEDDYVRYYNDDEKRFMLGRFINLWSWGHPDESSPYYGDARTMAFIRTATGTTYADIETVTLADELDDYEFIFGMEMS